MSVRDVCDLSSLLTGDDSEALELDRKLIALNASIEHQELRLQFEEDARYEQENVDIRLLAKMTGLNEKLDMLSLLLSEMATDSRLLIDHDRLFRRVTELESRKDGLDRVLDDLLNSLNHSQINIELLQSQIEYCSPKSLKLRQQDEALIRSEVDQATTVVHDLIDQVRRVEDCLVQKADMISNIKMINSEIISNISDVCNLQLTAIDRHREAADKQVTNMTKTSEMMLSNQAKLDSLEASLIEVQKLCNEGIECFDASKRALEDLVNSNNGLEDICSTITSQLAAQESSKLASQLSLDSELLNYNRLAAILQGDLMPRIGEESCKNSSYKRREDELVSEIFRLEEELSSLTAKLDASERDILEANSEMKDYHGAPDRQGYLADDLAFLTSNKDSIDREINELSDNITMLSQARDEVLGVSLDLTRALRELEIERANLASELEARQQDKRNLRASLDSRCPTQELQKVLADLALKEERMAIDKLELEKSMNSTSVALQELQDATIACLARNKVLYEQYWEHLLRQTKGARILEMNQSYQVVLDQAEDTLNDELLLKDRKFKDFYAEIKGRECDMQDTATRVLATKSEAIKVAIKRKSDMRQFLDLSRTANKHAIK